MEEQAPPPLPWTASLNERSENPSGIAPIKPPPHVPWLQQVRDNSQEGHCRPSSCSAAFS